MKNIIVLIMLFTLNAIADPAVVIPKSEDVGGKNVYTVEETFAKVSDILESSFVVMLSVKDEESLATSGVKLESLATEMLAIEAGVDIAQKPSDKQMRDFALRFITMNEKVDKQMKAVGLLKLPEEIIKARNAQFADFLRKIEPMKQKTNLLFPPDKLSYFAEQIKAEEARKNLK